MRGKIREINLTEMDKSRFSKFVQVTSGCHFWTGASCKASNGRYGNFSIKGIGYQAHRVSLVIADIALPNGGVVDHICRNTLCVNPKHLEVVSHKENTLRGVGPTAILARRKKCHRGHSVSDMRLKKDGYRRCMECQRIADAKYRAKKARLVCIEPIEKNLKE